MLNDTTEHESVQGESMRELIKVEKCQIGKEEINAVDARELHDFLVVGATFNSWILRRIEKYGFVINSDYSILNTATGAGGDDRKDYIISIDMAKELSMVENNDKGRQARKFFIERDKKLTEIEGGKVALPNFTNPAEAAIAWAMEYEARQIAEKTKAQINNKKTATAMATASHLSRENNRLRPKAALFDHFFESDNIYSLGNAFKLLDVNPYVSHRILIEQRIIYRLDNGYVPAEEYRKKGYLKTKLTQQGRNGQNYIQVYVTHTGLVWLREVLCVELEEDFEA